MSTFEGFHKDGVGFFHALKMQQSREWFAEHKEDFERLWNAPMKVFLDEMKPQLQKVYKRKLGDVKVFRIYRDVRFSKDKSPFKTWMAGLIPFAGYGKMEGPAALYLHLGLENFIAFGFYQLEPAQLKRYRAGLLDEKKGSALQKLVDAAGKVGMQADALETLKRPPPGVSPDHPRVELLKQKALGLSTSKIPDSVRYKKTFAKWVLGQAKVAAPILEWGFKNL
ncbi:MAG: DUF2461 domain-containing protein [Archangium sp.]|nr:DUF2461 domain-containing protein [Archangium sp.]